MIRNIYGKSLRYYAFSKDRQKEFAELVSNQKRQYLHLKDIITIDISRITFFADRMFEILDWCVETGVSKMGILHSHIDDNQKKTQLENLNDFDMENECDEITLLSTRIKADISTLVNSIS